MTEWGNGSTGGGLMWSNLTIHVCASWQTWVLLHCCNNGCPFGSVNKHFSTFSDIHCCLLELWSVPGGRLYRSHCGHSWSVHRGWLESLMPLLTVTLTSTLTLTGGCSDSQPRSCFLCLCHMVFPRLTFPLRTPAAGPGSINSNSWSEYEQRFWCILSARSLGETLEPFYTQQTS